MHCIVECRAITHYRTQLGDPSKDIWEYHIYSYLELTEINLQQCFNNTNALWVARKPNILELGGQYRIDFVPDKVGSIYCESVKVQQWSENCKKFVIITRTVGRYDDPSGIPGPYWELWVSSDTPMYVGERYKVTLTRVIK